MLGHDRFRLCTSNAVSWGGPDNPPWMPCFMRAIWVWSRRLSQLSLESCNHSWHLVGRTVELEKIRQAMKDGAVSALMLVALAGVGKTRLLMRNFVRRVARIDAVVSFWPKAESSPLAASEGIASPFSIRAWIGRSRRVSVCGSLRRRRRLSTRSGPRAEASRRNKAIGKILALDARERQVDTDQPSIVGGKLVGKCANGSSGEWKCHA
jgi:hypothetical protein